MEQPAPSTDPQVIDVRIIALDETEHYQIDPADVPYIESIMGIYMYDANTHTYCASSTPCYFLYHLENQVRVSEQGRLLSDDAQEKLYTKYEYHGDDDDFYVSSFRIDAMAERLIYEPYRYRILEDQPIPDDVTYDEAIEGIIEYCRANSQL